MQILHNPRCRKSRETLQLITDAGIEPEIIEYLKEVPTTEELKDILILLEMKPMELVRKTEAIWKENFKSKNLTDSQIVEAMVSHPKLIERPIVIKNGKAVLGRPPENVKAIL